MNIVIFEDDGWKDLQPLSLTRPVWELRCGIATLEEKIRDMFPGERFNYSCRDYIAPLVKKRRPGSTVNHTISGETLFLSGRAIYHNREDFSYFEEDTALYAEERLVGFYLTNPVDYHNQLLENAEGIFHSLTRRAIEAEIIAYPWDLVKKTRHHIPADLKNMKGLTEADPEEFKRTGAHIIPGEGVFLSGDVSIAPGAVLDSSEGPIYLAAGVEIMPNAVIIGPAAIGEGSTVKIGAKIYPGTSIGPVCKVGGEVEESIIHAYSNKQHEGFLGHAYIGEWCNIGAGTENSDLKNNYTPVKVQLNDKVVDTGSLFIGLFIGDHSKTGINTTFNTGSVMGVASMAFGAGFQPRFIPSFRWSDGRKLLKPGFKKTIETARAVMSRRNIELSDEEVYILKHIFENSAQ
ncbi:MAG: hypothetical protein HQ591_12830 [candidate division Zixibacteria bacterium]|nr:hypothetical protein [Candidatus Tariuqbacter arcticus]